MKALVFVAVFVLLLCSVPKVSCAEFDASASVVQVISGDTFETQSIGLIKLADIDPTCTDVDNSTGYVSAKSLLTALVGNKTVFLDIDDLYKTDYSGTGNRTVCVVYVDFNSTHYRNVNYVLLDQRLLAVNDQDNEFTPSTWTRFVRKQDIPEFSSAVLVVFLLVLIFVGLKKGKRF